MIKQPSVLRLRHRPWSRYWVATAAERHQFRVLLPNPGRLARPIGKPPQALLYLAEYSARGRSSISVSRTVRPGLYLNSVTLKPSASSPLVGSASPQLPGCGRSRKMTQDAPELAVGKTKAVSMQYRGAALPSDAAQSSSRGCHGVEFGGGEVRTPICVCRVSPRRSRGRTADPPVCSSERKIRKH